MSNLKITTLKDHSGLNKKVVDLVESSFQYSPPNQITTDFAPLFDSKFNYQNYILINEEKYTVHGHIGFRNRSLLLDDYVTPISILGGISISKEYRGKGHLKSLFKEVLTECEKNSTFLFLWSDKSNLYQKFNFVEVGIIAQTGTKSFDSFPATEWEKHKLNDLTTIEIEQIKKLYDLQTEKLCMIERSDEDWEELKKITSADFYIKRSEKGSIRMYFVVNKGQDLNGVIHEFGFKDSCKKDMLEELNDFKFWIPEIYADEEVSQYLYSAMIRIGNFEKFKEFVYNWSNGDITIVSGDLDNLKFDFNGDEFELSTSTFLQYIWGPEKIKEFASYFRPLYISGLDSL